MDRLFDGCLLMFDDLSWASKEVEHCRRCAKSPNPTLAAHYADRADRLERAIEATRADLEALQLELTR